MTDILTEYWRHRAKQVRNMVQSATADEMRDEMRSVAAVYDYLGDLAAQLAPSARIISAWQLAEIARPKPHPRPYSRSGTSRRAPTLQRRRSDRAA
jgi:hypothetical protein